MQFDQFEWLRRLKAVEREFSATRLAVEQFARQVELNPTLLENDLRPRDVVRANETLEGTYVVRLFAEFEFALREFWPTVRRTSAPNRARDLIQGLASTCKIGHEQLLNAHSVREYRNTLVHAPQLATQVVAIAQARSHLCHFVSRLC